jgi:pimeloyl-ACP methyl ester carboxylesterase
MAELDPEPFEVEGAGGVTLRAEERGEGSAVVLLHGVTAHRDLVVHGSKALPRAGYLTIGYDARGHGESDPGDEGTYGYESLADDLQAVIEARVPSGRPVLCGSSMGAHTALTLALRDPGGLAGVVAIGPASDGTRAGEGELSGWDELAAGLERGGVEGFIEVYEAQGLDPQWSETLVRIARERLSRHRHPEAVAQAMREVARSAPFDGIDALSGLRVPALIVASHDDADPGHPYEIATAYAEAIPDAELVSEERGESPLAWQGGKLSRLVADFCGRDAVRERTGG